MSESMRVCANRVVVIDYVLRNAEGEVLEASGDRPMAYLHGHGNLLAGLEAALEDKAVGDELTVELAAKDAYGELSGPGPQRVRKRDLGGRLKDPVEKGMGFQMDTKDGGSVTLWVHDAKGAWVWIDKNHPLAGKDLTFNLQVLYIRDASSEEIEHRHAHGPGGHHH